MSLLAAYLEAQGIAPPARPLPQGAAPNRNKRKRPHDAEPNAQPPKVSKTSRKQKKTRQLIEISDEEDVEKLAALRVSFIYRRKQNTQLIEFRRGLTERLRKKGFQLHKSRKR